MKEKLPLHVTEVEFVPIKPRDGLIGFASCVVDDQFYFGSIGVHTRLDGEGIRITYPARKIGNTNLPVYHPIKKEVNGAIRKAISEKVKELLSEEILQSEREA